jgi:valyl-tRNA synthetase
MSLPKRFDPATDEARLQTMWEERGVYRFPDAKDARVYSIDTPPVSDDGKILVGVGE